MNIPAPFSDAGTWQRLGAAADAGHAAAGLRRACVLFVVIWSVLILAGIFLSGATAVRDHWNSDTESLMTAVLRTLGSGGATTLALLFLLVLGLFSAMISTADSLLIAATQVTMTGLRNHERLLLEPKAALREGRWLVAILGVGAFSVFFVFHVIGLNVVQLVFAIYGAQLALFPTTAAALFLPQEANLRAVRHVALASIAAGFVAAWGVAIWGHVTESMDLQFYAPAAGLGAAAAIMVAGLPFAWRIAPVGEAGAHD